MSTQGTDGTSFLRLSLSYSEINSEILLTDETRDTTFRIENNSTILEPGNYLLDFSLEDNSGNEGSCTQTISVQDTLLPLLECQDISVNVDIERHENIVISESMLGFRTSDNCEVANIEFGPDEISCSDTGDTILYQVFVSDIHGNNSSCQQNISIEKEPLTLSFQLSLIHI